MSIRRAARIVVEAQKRFWVAVFAITLASLLVNDVCFAQNRFYLTVERSFSPHENVKMRLDFVNAQIPLVLRVLKPRDVEKFLDGQLNISRSYEMPLSDLNAGHYVLRGLNKVRSPLPQLRNLLSVEFRDGFGGSDFNDAIRAEAYPSDLVTPPQEITIGAPDGFEVVREHYVDLQTGGEIPKGLYGDWGWPPSDDYSFKVRDIDLEPLPDGLYLLQAVQYRTEAQALLQVSELATQVKQTTNQVLVRVLDRAGKAVPNAQVALRDARGQWRELESRTDTHGEILFAEPSDKLDTKLLVRVRDEKGNAAITDTDFLPAVNQDDSVFVLTDRPIFKPGESFFFKGIARSRQNGQLSIPTSNGPQAESFLERVDSTVSAANAPEKTGVKVTDFGTFSGSFDVRDTQLPGLYRVVTDLGGKPYAGELRVRDYVKPSFYLELLSRDDTIQPGQPFRFSFKGKRYAGGVPRGLKYEVFVYRKKFESPQWVEEAGGGLQSGHDYFGQTRSTSQLGTPQRLYSSVEERLKSAGDSDYGSSWLSAPQVDDGGVADVEILMPAVNEDEDDWIYTLVVRAMDRSASQAVLSENIYMTLSDAMPALRFDGVVAPESQKELTVGIQASSPDGCLAPDMQGHVELEFENPAGEVKRLPDIPFTTDQYGVTSVKFERPAPQGRVFAKALLEKNNGKEFRRAAHSERASIILGGKDGEQVLSVPRLELIPEKTILSPGESAQVLALLPKSRSGTLLWQTVSGTQIYERSATEVSGQSRWFAVTGKPEFGTGFYQTYTIPTQSGGFDEQTVGFRIVPLDKQLRVVVKPQDESGPPLAPFSVAVLVEDFEGQPVADVELSIGVVDKAVYDVAPEFRPSIVEFFYPLPRLNLATFYSDELQGYGYADEIRKPNFRLTALKSAQKPTKRNMRDTAGWFPHVVTDAKGSASVTLEMPANVTEWIVTAVAADKIGRVGEGRGNFRTTSDVGVELQMPSFLHEGDVVRGKIESSNNKNEMVNVAMSATVKGAVSVESGKPQDTVSVAPHASVLTPLLVRALEADDASRSATLSVHLDAPDAQVGGAREFGLEVLPASSTVNVAATVSGNQLSFRIPESAKPSELQVQVFSGLVGAALSAGRSLVSYPYGCTEQLLHTTIPNLALLDLIQKSNLTPTQIGALNLHWAVEQAQANAKRAMDRLSANQRADGGFGLWPSDKESQFGVTALAVRALSIAYSLKVERADSLMAKGREWLGQNASFVTSLPRGPMKAYVLSLLVDGGVYYPFDDTYVSFVQDIIDHPEVASIDELVATLKILNRRSDHYWFNEKVARPEAVTLVATNLIGQVKTMDTAALVRNASLDYEPQFGFSYGDAILRARVLAGLFAAEQLDENTRGSFTNAILKSHSRGAWSSTFENGEVLIELRELLEQELRELSESAGQLPEATVSTVSGERIGALERLPGAMVGTFSVANLKSPLSAIRISSKAGNEIQKAFLKAEVPYAALRSSGQGLRVDRQLFVIGANGKQEIGTQQRLSPGDVVISKVSVSRPQESNYYEGTSSFVVLEDGIPALAESIDEDRQYLEDANVIVDKDSYWVSVKDTQRYPNRTVRILELKPGGSRDFYQVWRARFSGTASVAPATAFDMYNDQISGTSSAASITIE